jgi:hypothetical protein
MWKTRVMPGIPGIPCQPAPNHVTCGTLGMLPTSPATGVGFPHSRGNDLDHTICTVITNIYVLPYRASHGASMTQSVRLETPCGREISSSRQGLGPTRSLPKRVPEALSPCVKRPGMKLTTHTSMQCRGLECVELYRHCHNSLVFN